MKSLLILYLLNIKRYYSASLIAQQHIDSELKENARFDIVEPSNSSWSSLIVLLPKKDRGYSFLMDFCKVIQVTKRDAYTLP